MTNTIRLDFTARDAEIRDITAQLATENDMSVRRVLVARLFQLRRGA